MGLASILGTYSEREVKRIRRTTSKILALEPTMQKLSDEELKHKTVEFRERLSNGEKLDNLLIEAFAVCREASARSLGMKHYEVQLVGGIVLHQGRISEMKTGEGKTLVATLPAYLNGLTGKGVHIVTVNDYLAHRDLMTLKPLYDFLGITSSVILHDHSPEERKEAYKSDIVYITNNELGFDYLRDNMINFKHERVLRGLNFAIVDEVDSILIDEARTPLIISGSGEEATHTYRVADIFVKTLEDEDYEIDEKVSSIVLTESGVLKVETVFGLENYADVENSFFRHYIDQSLRANFVMKKDKDYLIRNGDVLIIDTFTGRVAEGRRFSEGLHQAIEAKEGVKINPENKTLATITYQNFFKLYNKLSGMTGTGQTEEAEFREIYNLDVILIPTNKPIARIDHTDRLYLTADAKHRAIVQDIKDCYSIGQPVLVGTSSIEKSEMLSDMLKVEGIPHQVLNAKYHEIEAQIIAKAGEAKSITIATNMAGRGTDIKLGEGVYDLGGLKIIGTERHESRRIDNQLRGRSGRQGDPGESVFYISFEDDLMRIFASERIKNMISYMSKEEEDVAIENKMLTNAIEKAQKNIEGSNFETRKDTIQYDGVVNEQRKLIYEQRARIIDEDSIKDQIEHMIKDVFGSIVDNEFEEYLKSENEELFDTSLSNLKKIIEEGYLYYEAINLDKYKDKSLSEIKEAVIETALDLYKRKEAEMTEIDMRMAEKQILLMSVDRNWIEHITMLVDLKQAVRFEAYKQQDPIKAYILKGGELFNELIYNIKSDAVRGVLNITPIRTSNLEGTELTA